MIHKRLTSAGSLIKLVKINFRNLLFIYSLVIMLVSTLIISIQSYSSTARYILRNAENSSTSDLIQTNKMLESNILQIMKITDNLATSPTLAALIKEYEDSSDPAKASVNQQILSLLQAQRFMLNKYIKSIAVFTDKSVFYMGSYDFFHLTNQDIMLSPYFSPLTADRDSTVLFNPDTHEDTRPQSSDISYLTDNFCTGRLLTDEGNSIPGSVFIIINPEIFSDVFNSKGNFLVLDARDEIIWNGSNVTAEDVTLAKKHLSEKFNASNINKVTGKEGMVYISRSDLLHFKIIYFNKISSISSELRNLRWFFIFTFLVTAVFSFAASRVYSGRITRPIGRLIQIIRKYRLNGRDVRYVPDKRLKFNYRDSIFYFLLLTVICPIIISIGFSYIYSSQVIKSYIIQSNKNAFIQTAENIGKYFENKRIVISGIMLDRNVQDFITGDRTVPAADLKTLVDRYLQLHEGRDDIFIYNMNKQQIYPDTGRLSDNTTLSADDLGKISGDGSIFKCLETRKDSFNRYMFNFVAQINHSRLYSPIGYIQCQISEHYLEDMYKNTIKEGVNLFIINQEGTIVSHPDKSLINTKFQPEQTGFRQEDGDRVDFLQGKDSFVFSMPIPNTFWALAGVYRNSIFDKDTWQALNEKIYILIIMIFVIIFLSLMTSLSLASSIGRINSLLRKLGIDNIEISFPEDSKIFEINELGIAFNDMILRIETLLDQLILSARKQNELENSKKEADMIALQKQINPHFLYNTFESINWLIQSEDKANAMKMVSSLSDMLRFIARSSNTLVPLSEEIQYAATYIGIMKARFEKSIYFDMDIDEGLLQYKTVKLTLQPLIENAIYHGITLEKEGGIIRLNCREQEDELVLSVSDNGKGMEESKLIELKEALNVNAMQNNSIGLYNVQARVRLMFGEKYGLRIHSVYRSGTTVSITIPKMK